MTQSFDWDKPIEDTSGNPAKVISKDFRISGRTLHVVQIDMGSTGSFVRYYCPDGREYHGGVSIYPPHELRNKKEKREGWVNVYSVGNGANKQLNTGMRVYKSEHAAVDIGKFHSGAVRLAENLGVPPDTHDNMLRRTYVATVKIEVEV